MTPEGKVKAKVKKVLKEYRAYQHWPVQAGYGAPTLDCVGCYNHLYFAIETKAPGKKPTPRQQLTIEEMEAAGAKVFVIGEVEIKDRKTYSGMDELIEWLLAHA